MLKFSALLLAGLAVTGCTPAAVNTSNRLADTPLIPREVFFGNPDRANVRISPDGSMLSFLAPNGGVMNVWVQSIGEDGTALSTPRPVTGSMQRPIRIYYWAYNSQQILYAQDRGGDENFKMYAVDVETGEEVELTPFDNVQARLVALDQNFPDEALVAVNNRNPQVHDVWRVNTRTGEGAMIFQNDAGYAGILADSDFQIRVAYRISPSTGGIEAHARDSAEGEWYELAKWSLEDSAASEPRAISRDGRTIYLADSRGVNTSRLYAYEIDDDGTPTYTLVAADERADVQETVSDPNTGRPQAVAFEYARKEWTILDPAIADDWEYLTNLARGDFSIASRDLADTKWIVRYVRDDGPVSYYLYDRQSHSASFLFTNRSQLQDLPLAKMEPVVIRSRDGLSLVCYLTTPVGTPERTGRNRRNITPMPMVLLVHGGPWARDSWGYNTLHQWLANRGYAVLSVNFRGSTGMGKDFMNAGNLEWAGTMHNDLIDAVNWAVEQNVADADRVAIMGGSYGGYATLVGLTFTPEFFAAGVDIVGPSHVRTLLETIPPYWEPIKAMFERRVGSLDNPGHLDSISPLTRVDAIRKPLLIGQGRNDPRVKESESEQIVQAMQEKGLPVTYVVFPDEGHGFARPQNSMAFFAITEAFLAQHLGGRFQEIGSDVEASTAEIPAGAELIPGLSRTASQ